jgi:hypothetical protein
VRNIASDAMSLLRNIASDAMSLLRNIASDANRESTSPENIQGASASGSALVVLCIAPVESEVNRLQQARLIAAHPVG